MTETEDTPWWKKPWVWLVTAVSVVGGILAFFFTIGRRGRVTVPRPRDLETPERPELDDVKVPERKNVATKPKDEYDEKKREASTLDEAMARANARDDK